MEFCARAIFDRRGSAVSHGPTRKLTYVRTTVKGNIVNINVYKTANKDRRKRPGQPLVCFFIQNIRALTLLTTW